MKKALSVHDVECAIHNQWKLYQDVQGKTFELDLIFVLQMKFIDIISMIKEGRLFYQTDY